MRTRKSGSEKPALDAFAGPAHMQGSLGQTGECGHRRAAGVDGRVGGEAASTSGNAASSAVAGAQAFDGAGTNHILEGAARE